MEQRKPEYRVSKITFETQLCKSCGGTKTKQVNLGNRQFKTVNCTTCGGTGVYTYEKHTDVDLITALNEMGMYRMIENTVKEIINDK